MVMKTTDLTCLLFCPSFVDLVGFTAWSGSRAPADVFLLLETIYGRFDQLAKQYKVFKVR